MPYETRCKIGRTSAKGSFPRSRILIFRNERTRSTHCILNSCFGMFRTIWVNFEQFGLFTKLGAKRAELVQKFVPRSHVGIFRNKRTRSTPLDPKLLFWCISYNLGAFGTIWLPYVPRCKMGRTSAKGCATKLRRNFSQRTHPIIPVDPKLMFWCILFYLCALRTVLLVMKLGAKRADLVQKFVPRSCVGIFSN